MEIYFKNKKMQKTCNSLQEMIREWGPEFARQLARRLTELRAADSLADIALLPQARCHELVNNRKGQLAVDLKHPFRLIFVPCHDPIPRKSDGGVDWTRVTAVCIIGVEDYHGN